MFQIVAVAEDLTIEFKKANAVPEESEDLDSSKFARVMHEPMTRHGSLCAVRGGNERSHDSNYPAWLCGPSRSFMTKLFARRHDVLCTGRASTFSARLCN
jgi:hypothetical protein